MNPDETLDTPAKGRRTRETPQVDVEEQARSDELEKLIDAEDAPSDVESGKGAKLPPPR